MFYLIGILSGLMLAVQNPYNSNFGKQLASPIAGGFMVYVLGTIEFLLLLLITRANVAGILSLGFGHGNMVARWCNGSRLHHKHHHLVPYLRTNQRRHLSTLGQNFLRSHL